jgi:hypothetical protein
MSRSRVASVIVFFSTGFLLLDSLRRHGSYSVLYSGIFALATLVMLVLLLRPK